MTGSEAPLRAVDRLLAAYNLLLAALWVTLVRRSEFAVWAVGVHCAAASIPALLRRAPPLSRPVSALREIYPLLWLPALWTEIGMILPLLHGATRDVAVAQLDVRVFGGLWRAGALPRSPARWVSEAAYAAYVAYLPLIYALPAAAALRGRMDALRDMALRLPLGFVGCYLVNLVFPVLGPRAFVPADQPALFPGVMYAFSEGLRRAGDALGTAFPSSHIVGAITLAWLGRRWYSPRVARILAAEAVGLCFVTVYTGNHYTVDVVAGLALGLALQAAVTPELVPRLWPRAARRRAPAAERVAPAEAL